MFKKLERCMLGFLAISIITLSIGPVAVAEEKSSVRIDFWVWGDTHTDPYEAVLNSFKAEMLRKHNIDIRYKWIPSQSVDELFVTAALAGKGYDIAGEFQGATFTKRVASGNFMPLDDYFPREEYGDYLAYNDLIFDGKLYAMALAPYPERIVFNKGLFRKAGLDPDAFPETWDDFLQACAKLKAAGITPLVWGNKGGLANEVTFNVWTVQAFDSTDEMKNITSGDGSWVHPKLIEWLHMYKSLYDKGYFQEGGLSYTFDEVYSAALVGDKAAMGIYHGPSPYMVLKDERGEDIAGFASIPVWSDGELKDAVPFIAEPFGIAPWTKHVDEAVTVLKEMIGVEWQTKLLLEADRLPGNPNVDVSLVEDPYIGDLIARMQKKSVPSWYPLYSHPEWQAQIRYITLFLLGEVTAEEALAQMDAAKGKK